MLLLTPRHCISSTRSTATAVDSTYRTREGESCAKKPECQAASVNGVLHPSGSRSRFSRAHPRGKCFRRHWHYYANTPYCQARLRNKHNLAGNRRVYGDGGGRSCGAVKPPQEHLPLRSRDMNKVARRYPRRLVSQDTTHVTPA
jgi:hypothetical protein